jgi:hypothetical protein
MNEAIRLPVDLEQEWETTHQRTIDALQMIGSLVGDDPALLQAKAECVYQVLRRMVDDIPSVQVAVQVPTDLTPEQVDQISAVIKQAALKGVEVAVSHCAQEFMGSIYDLCTSKLTAFAPRAS